MEPNAYVGVWMTADGYIRHELLPDGRYDEARGGQASAYQGRCWIEGSHIEYDMEDFAIRHGAANPAASFPDAASARQPAVSLR